LLAGPGGSVGDLHLLHAVGGAGVLAVVLRLVGAALLLYTTLFRSGDDDLRGSDAGAQLQGGVGRAAAVVLADLQMAVAGIEDEGADADATLLVLLPDGRCPLAVEGDGAGRPIQFIGAGRAGGLQGD